jgi:uncharacterized protein YqeY
MSLMQTASKGIAEAMKARDQERLAPLRMLKTALMNREVERGRALTDAEELQVVSSLIKQRRESIEQFERGGRADLAAKEATEIKVLEAFLPPALSEEELTKFVDDAIRESGATSARDLGKVMKVLMPRLATPSTARRSTPSSGAASAAEPVLFDQTFRRLSSSQSTARVKSL